MTEKEKRVFPRVTINFPIKLPPSFLTQTVDLSESGLGFMLDKPLLLSKAKAEIEISPSQKIEAEFKVIWSKQLAEFKRFKYGVAFIRLKKKDLNILRMILCENGSLNPSFVSHVKELRNFLEYTKAGFDDFDKKNPAAEKQNNFINAEKDAIFKDLDMHFDNIWKVAENFNRSEYLLHQKFTQNMLWYLLRDPAETNKLVCEKPLGYAGDFIVINYLYDYYNKFLGGSSYEKLINFYTCSIPISFSVVERKNFLKRKILELCHSRKCPRILNVGSGPTRELFELLNDNKIQSPVYFDCLDFEKRALDYVRDELEKIEKDKKANLYLRLIRKNITELIKNKNIEDMFDEYDLIYSSGTFDYLSDRSAKRTIANLYNMLAKKGTLILTNVKKNEATHRIYYEMLGDWNLRHRTKENIVNWLGDIKGADMKFEDLDGNAFWFLSLQRNKY